MRWMRFFCCAALCLLLTSTTLAQADLSPIIALSDGGIYAVSPADGSTHTLVAPHPDHTAIWEMTRDRVTLFSAEWLSPDGHSLAYRTLVENALEQAETVGGLPLEHALFVLDVATGDSRPVALVDDDRGATHIIVESVAWSLDGLRLHSLVVRRNRRTESTIGWALITHERGAWDQPDIIRVPDPDYAMARRIFATEDGVVLVDRGIQSPRIVLTPVNHASGVQNPVEIDWKLSPDLNLYMNTPLNPLHTEYGLLFGLTRQNSDELAFLAFPDSGEIAMIDGGSFPALVSGLAPDTSLRVSTNLYSGDHTMLLIRTADGDVIGDTPGIRAYAFGIPGDSNGSTFALAPDGQALAWLQDGELMLWRDGEVTPLGFSANALAWGPVLYVPVYDPQWMLG